jgi:hypothetical protein
MVAEPLSHLPFALSSSSSRALFLLGSFFLYVLNGVAEDEIRSLPERIGEAFLL